MGLANHTFLSGDKILQVSSIGISCVVGDLQNGLLLVSVGQNAYIFFFFQTEDLLLYFMYSHVISLSLHIFRFPGLERGQKAGLI